jgi:hypothetical protein
MDPECLSIPHPADMPPLQTEDARRESEMDPSDISNVSAANLVRATSQNLE